MTRARIAFLLVVVCFPASSSAQKIYTYVGRIASDSFLLAWGTTEGSGNTIGRGSVPLGKAVVEVDGRQVPSERNWIAVKDLAPDTAYPYRLLIAGRVVARGTVRTFPQAATKLSFFVIGDYGTGKPPQYEIAQTMWREFEKRRSSDNPVRFVLTTGDNIYPDRFLGLVEISKGEKDRDWEEKFFEPYELLLRQIPFYPTVGNHDRRGQPEEVNEDLTTFLDNFFFPSNVTMPHYAFSFGGLADFFALDTTAMWTQRPLVGSLTERGGQFRWLQAVLARAQAPWKIAYFHHPPFNAGPGHDSSMESLAHVVKLFQTSGVQAVFSGHEHNFQVSKQNEATGGVLYVVTGAGGQLRPADVRGNMDSANIAASSGQRHFLLVEIEDQTMKITPLSADPVLVRNRAGNQIPLPIVLPLSSREAQRSLTQTR